MGNPNSAKASIGYWMERMGLLGLPIGFGALIGFYMADQEMRLVPEFLSIILVALSFSLLCIVLGRLFARQLYRETQQQKKVRKRVIACIVALLLLPFILQWVNLSSQ